ncbi:ABC transporter permease [Flavobacteriales bacterium 33_180_T64]|nr:ABC transporter permease [Flavobacteriales bacterium 33_180_T64]
MHFSLYIAKRYLFSKSNNSAINIMSIIAALGIVIASAALFIVLSGFAGLKDFSLEFTSFVDPDLKITSSQGKSFVLSKKDSVAISTIEGISSYSKIIEERIIVEFDNKKKLATIKGVDENYTRVTSIDSMVIYGEWFAKNTDQIVSGWGLSSSLSFGVLDYAKPITIYVPKPGKGQISSVKSAYNSIKATNVGVFQINETIDNEFVYSNFETAQYLLNYSPNQLSALEFKLDGTVDEEVIRQRINSIFGGTVVIKNRIQLNDSLYKMLNTENLVVYLIFTLVIIIALFNIIGALIMMILDKKGSLNTLYSLGTPTEDIRRIFFLQGSLMTLLGGVIGIVLGFLLVLNQLYGPDVLKLMITSSLPYPVALKPINFLIVLLTIGVLGVLASKIASSRITKSLVKH